MLHIINLRVSYQNFSSPLAGPGPVLDEFLKQMLTVNIGP